MADISNRTVPQLAALLFCSGWAIVFLGFFELISETSSMFGAITFWILAAILLIMDRVKTYQNKHASLQTNWDEFEGEFDADISPLPDPNDVGLDLPL